MAEVPPSGSQEYLWWSAGANDEAKARNEGMTAAAREVREVLEGLARIQSSDGYRSASTLVGMLARIYCPEKLKRRHRK